MESKTDSWPQKVVDWHLKMAGLNEDNNLDKYLPWSRGVMLTLIFISIFQQLYGISALLRKGDSTLAQIVIILEYVFIISGGIDETYSLVYRKAVARKCVKNSTEPLHCLLHVEEETICRKHMPLFKFLMLCYVISLYVGYVIIVFISPLFRFCLNLGSASFVLYPIWYPVDVFSSRRRFWAAFLYESMIFAVVVYTISTKNSVFLCLSIRARVRCEALSQFITEITPQCRYRVSSSYQSEPEDNILSTNSVHSRHGSTFESLGTSGASGDLYAFIFNSNNECLESFRRSVEDLHKLRRQLKLINDTFKALFTVCHLIAFLSVILLTFAMANEFRNLVRMQKNASTDIFMFAVFDVACIMQVYTLSYVTTLLQESYESLRFSFWEMAWYAEKVEFKRLFMHTKAVLNQPLAMKAYTFYPINLVTFNSSLKESCRIILFLYQLTAAK